MKSQKAKEFIDEVFFTSINNVYLGKDLLLKSQCEHAVELAEQEMEEMYKDYVPKEKAIEAFKKIVDDLSYDQRVNCANIYNDELGYTQPDNYLYIRLLKCAQPNYMQDFINQLK
jgi:hypothetical protein